MSARDHDDSGAEIRLTLDGSRVHGNVTLEIDRAHLRALIAAVLAAHTAVLDYEGEPNAEERRLMQAHEDALAAYRRETNPATLTALLDALEGAEARVTELEPIATGQYFTHQHGRMQMEMAKVNARAEQAETVLAAMTQAREAAEQELASAMQAVGSWLDEARRYKSERDMEKARADAAEQSLAEVRGALEDTRAVLVELMPVDARRLSRAVERIDEVLKPAPRRTEVGHE